MQLKVQAMKIKLFLLKFPDYAQDCPRCFYYSCPEDAALPFHVGPNTQDANDAVEDMLPIT